MCGESPHVIFITKEFVMILEKPKLTVDSLYHLKLHEPSDINEHLPTLKIYAENCDHVTEFGVRSVVSTYGFMAGRPRIIRSYDIQPVENFGVDSGYLSFLAAQIGIDFQFLLGNTLEIEIEQTDLLFIDTLHTYNQLKRELELHSSKVNKYIVLHDTTTFADIGEYDELGLWPAVEEFVNANENWVIQARYINNNGLTILKRVI